MVNTPLQTQILRFYTFYLTTKITFLIPFIPALSYSEIIYWENQLTHSDTLLTFMHDLPEYQFW